MAETVQHMVYKVFRWFTGIALHWFYSSIQVSGQQNVPATGPVIIAASHHNALVDALIAGWITPRRLTLTAKATLMDNPLLSWLLSLVGVVPLRRASDEHKRYPADKLDISRNADAFKSIIDVLSNNGTVLIFPEGKSHSNPELAPLKTGVSRIAIEARNQRHIKNLQIVPLGLSFEEKGNPGTAVLAEFGNPLLLDQIEPITVEELTALLATRLAAVSLKKPVPSSDREGVRKKGAIHPLSSPLAAWGELTHRWVINYARDLAIIRSKTPDDPAMLTIIFALIFILASYALQFAFITLLLSPLWAFLYVASLPIGAYWAAFRNHPQQT